jgi:hypothetical protein
MFLLLQELVAEEGFARIVMIICFDERLLFIDGTSSLVRIMQMSVAVASLIRLLLTDLILSRLIPLVHFLHDNH